MEQAGSSFVCTEAECADEPVLQRVVFAVIRSLANEVQQARRCLLVKGREDVEVPGVIRRNPAEVELRFSLYKPDLRLGGPESWQLERDCVFLCHE